MYEPLPPLEETLAYKNIFAKGEHAGEKRGEERGEKRGEIKGQIELAQKIHDQGIISEEQYLETVKPLEKRLAMITKRRRARPKPGS
jgi:predicted transposase YdaD